MEDMLKSWDHAQSEIARQGTEIGELRKKATGQLSPSPTMAVPPAPPAPSPKAPEPLSAEEQKRVDEFYAALPEDKKLLVTSSDEARAAFVEEFRRVSPKTPPPSFFAKPSSQPSPSTSDLQKEIKAIFANMTRQTTPARPGVSGLPHSSPTGGNPVSGSISAEGDLLSQIRTVPGVGARV